MLGVGKVSTARGLGLIERLEPKIGQPTEVLIEVAACGVCGADLSIYEGHEEIISMVLPYGLPRILGHEIAGTVVEVGAEVTEVKVGDPVACNPGAGCGHCYFCLRGKSSLCDNRGGTSLGISRDGGYARYTVAQAKQLHKVPSTIRLGDAAVLEPAAVSFRAVESSCIKPGDMAIVIGPGPLGLLAGLMLKATGVRNLLVAGRASSRSRLDFAEALGLATVEMDGDNLLQKVRTLTDGRGADVVFDFAGGAESFGEALKVVRKAGEVVLSGTGAPGVCDPSAIVFREISVIGLRGRVASTWKRLIELQANGTIDIGQVVTHRIPLSDYEEGFQMLLQRKALKVVFDPSK